MCDMPMICLQYSISNYEPPDNDKDGDVSERHRSEQVSRFQHGPLASTCAGSDSELHAADPSSELSTEQGLGVYYSIIDKSTVLYQDWNSACGSDYAIIKPAGAQTWRI
jgi:hypothetical protein